MKLGCLTTESGGPTGTARLALVRAGHRPCNRGGPAVERSDAALRAEIHLAQQAAEGRARRRAAINWIALATPLTLAVLAFGYSDQAPAALGQRRHRVDRSLGSGSPG